jgi:uncharacterized protein (TIGR03435 family)
MHMKIFHTGLLLCAAALGTQAAERLEFEVASVKPSVLGADPSTVTVGIRMDGAQFASNYFSLKDYIRIAFKVKMYQIEGPEWITSEHYDVTAKMPAGATRDQVPDMLKSLLADRFKLTYHKGSKEFPVYGFVVSKNGTKLKAVDEGAAAADDGKTPFTVDAQGSANGVSINLGNGSYFALLPDHLEVRKLTFVQIGDVLSRFVDLPIVDMTNMPGKFNIDVKITPDDYRMLLLRGAASAGIAVPLPPEGAGAGDSLIAGLEAQGIRLERRKAPLDTIIVDHAEKTPTAN